MRLRPRRLPARRHVVGRRLYAPPPHRRDELPRRLDKAPDHAICRVSDGAFSRSIHGVAVPHFYRGEQVGEHRRYDERLTMFLLRYRDPLRYAKTLDRFLYEGRPAEVAVKLGVAIARMLENAAWEETDDPEGEFDPHPPEPGEDDAPSDGPHGPPPAP